jgi:ribonuclease VapC
VIVADTSAIVAILWVEPEADDYSRILLSAKSVLIAAPTRLELAIVCRNRQGPDGPDRADQLLKNFRATTEPFDEQLFEIAQTAHARYGHGRYGLNFGDCFSYALAKARNAPLLFKGRDFSATDVIPAI